MNLMTYSPQKIESKLDNELRFDLPVRCVQAGRNNGNRRMIDCTGIFRRMILSVLFTIAISVVIAVIFTSVSAQSPHCSCCGEEPRCNGRGSTGDTELG